MVKRIGTARSKTRHKFSKNFRRRGKISVSSYFQQFKEGEKVYLNPEPSVLKGMPHRRFFGKTGIVQGQRGNCYAVLIKDQNKPKTIIIHPIHLKKV